MKVQCPKCDHVFIATQDDEMCDIDITISDENFLAIAKKAHEQDITMNQFIINTLRNPKEDCIIFVCVWMGLFCEGGPVSF